MKTNLSLVCALGALAMLAGCPKRQSGSEQNPSESGSSAATAGRDAADKAIKHFGAEPYHVCDLGTHDDHAGFKGTHVAHGDAVVLLRTGDTLKLRLGSDEVVVTPSADGTLLEGVSAFKHEPVGSPTMIEHKVVVEKHPEYKEPVDAEENTFCKKSESRTIIRIDFCPPDTSGGFVCSAPSSHGGDVHANN